MVGGWKHDVFLIISGPAVSASIMAAIRPGETPAPLLLEVPL